MEGDKVFYIVFKNPPSTPFDEHDKLSFAVQAHDNDKGEVVYPKFLNIEKFGWGEYDDYGGISEKIDGGEVFGRIVFFHALPIDEIVFDGKRPDVIQCSEILKIIKVCQMARKPFVASCVYGSQHFEASEAGLQEKVLDVTRRVLDLKKGWLMS